MKSICAAIMAIECGDRLSVNAKLRDLIVQVTEHPADWTPGAIQLLVRWYETRAKEDT